MTVRIVQPADGTAYVSYTWDFGTQILPAGAMIDVPPGSALETAIGTASLITPTAQQLAEAANGGAGAISNLGGSRGTEQVRRHRDDHGPGWHGGDACSR